jgi:hypothetical protein
MKLLIYVSIYIIHLDTQRLEELDHCNSVQYESHSEQIVKFCF